MFSNFIYLTSCSILQRQEAFVNVHWKISNIRTIFALIIAVLAKLEFILHQRSNKHRYICTCVLCFSYGLIILPMCMLYSVNDLIA